MFVIHTMLVIASILVLIVMKLIMAANDRFWY